MDRYRKEVLQLSTRKHGINVQYLYDNNIEGLCCLRVTDVKYKILFSGTCCSPDSHLAKISRLSTSKIAQGSSQNGANHSKNKPLVTL